MRGTSAMAGMAAAPNPAHAVDGDLSKPRFGQSRAVVLAWRAVQGAAGLVVLGAIWEGLRAAGLLDPAVAPSLPAVLTSLWRGLVDGTMPVAIGNTLGIWAISVGVAVVVGVPLGLLTGLSSWAEAALRPLFDLLRTVPSVAILPMAIMTLGVGATMQVPIVALGALWPLLLGAHYGVADAEPLFLDVARSMRAGRYRVLSRVVLPAALPSIMTGLRLAVVIALAVSVGLEVVLGTGSGIGSLVYGAASRGDTTTAVAGGIASALVGVAIALAEVRLEKVVLRWSPEHRS